MCNVNENLYENKNRKRFYDKKLLVFSVEILHF